MNTKYLIGTLLISSIFLASCTNSNTETVPTPSDSTSGMVESTQNEDEMIPMENEEEQWVVIGGNIMLPSNSIVDNVAGSQDHTTLVAAVGAADLVQALSESGPFTLFAPTNRAFNDLPEGTVESLILPENKESLTSILTYHVVPGSYTSDKLLDGLELITLQGDSLMITYENDMWMVNGVSIGVADVISSNGAIHSINGVLMPNWDSEMEDESTMQEDNRDEA